jgi:hypothetical protein
VLDKLHFSVAIASTNISFLYSLLYFNGYEEKGHKTPTHFSAFSCVYGARPRSGFSRVGEERDGKAAVEGQAARPRKGKCLPQIACPRHLCPSCVAAAIAYNATLVHKDPEFEPFKEIPQEILK